MTARISASSTPARYGFITMPAAPQANSTYFGGIGSEA
jgi:hypothetical protein